MGSSLEVYRYGYFLDCRGTTATHPFFDDMHPGTDGFKALARKFEAVFTTGKLRAAAARKRPKTKRRKATRRTRSRRAK
jgi:hypothetical protein